VIRAFDLATGQRDSLSETAHRPWPLPARSWLMGQTWEELLFAHWRVDGEALRRLLPPGLDLQEHSGSGWLGVTPFRVAGLRLRGTLPLPVVSSFPELNVRTYVTAGGKPGIWFFSLETPSRLAVVAARRTYRLPYRVAEVVLAREEGRRRYAASRSGQSVLTADVVTEDAPAAAAPGTLEHFLVERYCHYAVDGTTLHRAEIHHRPWLLQQVSGTVELGLLPAGVPRPESPPLLHFAERQDTVIWSLEPA
jgi:uncharacterized protein